MGKTVTLLTGNNIQNVCRSNQLCAGLEASIEATVHAVNTLFEEHQGSGWGVLLIDAAYAFNGLNGKAAQWHARHLWPRSSCYLFNTYKAWATLVVSGSNSSSLHYSKERTTHKDPLSMAFYVVKVLPMIMSLKGLENGHIFGTLMKSAAVGSSLCFTIGSTI